MGGGTFNGSGPEAITSSRGPRQTWKQNEFTRGNVPVCAHGEDPWSSAGAVPPTTPEQLRAYCPSIRPELWVEWCWCCCSSCHQIGPQRAEPEAASRAQPRPQPSLPVGLRSFGEEKYSCFLKYVSFYKNSSDHGVTPRLVIYMFNY